MLLTSKHAQRVHRDLAREVSVQDRRRSILQRIGRHSVVAVALACVTPVASAEVIFSDGFESGDLSHQENGVHWGGNRDTAVSTTRAMEGSYALEFTFEGGPDGDDAFSEQRFGLGTGHDELWVAYDLYVPQNYHHRTQSSSANNKGFLYLWSGDYGNPSGPGMGPNFWPDQSGNGESSATLFAWGSGSSEIGRSGRHYNRFSRNVIRSEDRGTWIKVVARYKYASSSNDDGVAQIWIRDGSGSMENVLNIRDGAWYVPGQPGFDQGYLLGWANSGFDETTRFYIDNFVVSTTPLISSVRPSPPTGVSVVE